MAVATMTPNGSTHLLDRKLKKVSDYEGFGRGIASAAIAEARRQMRERTANGTSTTGAVDVRITTTLHVRADDGDDIVRVSAETPDGKQTVNV